MASYVATTCRAFGLWLRLIVRRCFLQQRLPDMASNFAPSVVTTGDTIPIRPGRAKLWAITPPEELDWLTAN
jgi:hypothetical protein